MKRSLLLFLLLAWMLVAPAMRAQTPDSTCLARGRVTTDSLARLHLTSTVLTQYQLRNLRALDSLHAARCVRPRVDTLVVRDTVVVQPPPDTTPTPPPPPPPPPVVVTRTGWAAIVDSVLGPIPDCGRVRVSSVPVARQWLANWEMWEPKHWAADSMVWSAANYYDRASIYYAMAACYSASDSARAALYLQRGHAIATNYRDAYLVPNDGGVSHHWMQFEGLALHALLTNNAQSARMVGRMADVAFGGYYRARSFGDTTHRNMDNRIAQRAILGGLLAMRLQVPAKSWTVADWPRKIDSLVTMTYRGQNPTIGRWCYRCTRSLDSMTFTAPFMDGLLADVAEKYARWYPTGPQVQRLPGLRRSTYDFLLASALRADSSFMYNVTPSIVEGGNGASVDLNLFHPAGLATLWMETGDVRYRDAAQQLFAKGVKDGWLSGTKQFNQAYYSSYRYIAHLIP